MLFLDMLGLLRKEQLNQSREQFRSNMNREAILSDWKNCSNLKNRSISYSEMPLGRAKYVLGAPGQLKIALSSDKGWQWEDF